jgi:hypothetical protein
MAQLRVMCAHQQWRSLYVPSNLQPSRLFCCGFERLFTMQKLYFGECVYGKYTKFGAKAWLRNTCKLVLPHTDQMCHEHQMLKFQI